MKVVLRTLTFLVVLVYQHKFSVACSNHEKDLVFMLDESSSITQPKYELMKAFILKLVDDIGVSVVTTHVGLVNYSESASVQFELDKYNSTVGVLGSIRALDLPNGGSGNGFICTALDASIGVFNRSSRSTAARIAILLTDGRPYKTPIAKAAADTLKANGVKIITIGVGKHQKSVAELASPGEHLTTANFSLLLQSVALVADRVCNKTVQFAGGTAASGGIVEVFHNGQWRRVCARGWTTGSSEVVCRQLGLSGGSSNTTLPVHKTASMVGGIQCNGNEASVGSCDWLSWEGRSMNKGLFEILNWFHSQWKGLTEEARRGLQELAHRVSSRGRFNGCKLKLWRLQLGGQKNQRWLKLKLAHSVAFRKLCRRCGLKLKRVMGRWRWRGMKNRRWWRGMKNRRWWRLRGRRIPIWRRRRYRRDQMRLKLRVKRRARRRWGRRKKNHRKSKLRGKLRLKVKRVKGGSWSGGKKNQKRWRLRGRKFYRWLRRTLKMIHRRYGVNFKGFLRGKKNRRQLRGRKNRKWFKHELKGILRRLELKRGSILVDFFRKILNSKPIYTCRNVIVSCVP